MSLPQLIGLECVACRKSIASIIDGAFCDACGNPVHANCLGAANETGIVVGDAPPTSHSPTATCSICGGDPESEIARDVRRNRGAQVQINAIRTSPVDYPVAKTCPNCKSEKFTRERPEKWVTFAWDRRCSDCGTRYTPPTPLWAAAVFVVIGLVGLVIGAFGLMARDICTVLIGVLGLLALIHGIRSFIHSGKV